MTTPKKYYIPTNSHGNLSSFPKDKKWVRFTHADINRRKPAHRSALQSGRIFYYEVCEGFTGGKYGWSPLLAPIIHYDQLPLFHRLVSQYEKQKARQKKKQSRNRARLKKSMTQLQLADPTRKDTIAKLINEAEACVDGIEKRNDKALSQYMGRVNFVRLKIESYRNILAHHVGGLEKSLDEVNSKLLKRYT